jgi:hypothetical protein
LTHITAHVHNKAYVLIRLQKRCGRAFDNGTVLSRLIEQLRLGSSHFEQVRETSVLKELQRLGEKLHEIDTLTSLSD